MDFVDFCIDGASRMGHNSIHDGRQAKHWEVFHTENVKSTSRDSKGHKDRAIIWHGLSPFYACASSGASASWPTWRACLTLGQSQRIACRKIHIHTHTTHTHIHTRHIKQTNKKEQGKT
jgi:hypothetical protein